LISKTFQRKIRLLTNSKEGIKQGRFVKIREKKFLR